MSLFLLAKGWLHLPITFWVVITALLFVATLVFFIKGLGAKENRLLLWSLGLLLLFFTSFGYTMFRVFSYAFDSAIEKVGDAMKTEKKDGKVVYSEMFGEPEAECLEVKGQERIGSSLIPVATWLHVKTCPAEMERVASQMDSGIVKRSKGEVFPVDSPFDISLKGDSILYYQRMGDRGDGQEFVSVFAALDSSEAYCMKGRGRK